MMRIIEQLCDTAERCADAGIITQQDAVTIIECIERVDTELYSGYEEFSEGENMTRKMLEPRWKKMVADERIRTGKELELKWKKMLADKDAELADKDAEIARLRALCGH
jgi:hypothetical protein